VLEPLSLPFFQRGLIEVILLAGVSGLLGTWIVLRGLSFFSHAAATATFPGLVLADGLGFAPLLGGLGAALLAAALLGLLVRKRSVASDSATALVLAGALALGVILASDFFGSQGSVDRLLFGSLLAISSADLLLAALTLLLAAVAGRLIGSRWLSIGFDNQPQLERRRQDQVLIVLVALAVVATLASVGALLTGAILILPAATTRLVTNRLPQWQIATAALAAAEGVTGMNIAYQLNLPPGPAIAVLGGLTFVLVLAVRHLLRLGALRPGLAVAGAVLVTLIAAGCGDSASSGDREKLNVAATTTQIGDLVRQVGGSTVNVNQILQPNSEAHDYQPRPDDVAGVAGSKLLFVSGYGLDDWGRELLDQSGSKAELVDLSSGLPVSLKAADGSETDPHWWHDLSNLEAATTEVEKALTAAEPEAKQQIMTNAEAYRTRIRKTDAAIRACLQRIAREERLIVTDHDAFIYFTDRYQVTSVGAVFPSTSTEGQASAGEVAALEQTIRDKGVRAVFPESSLNPALADRIAKDTGASSDYTLYGDTLGPADSPQGTVLGAEAANAKAIVSGITAGQVECSIPD